MSPIKRARIRIAAAYLKRVKRKTSPLAESNRVRLKELDRKLRAYGKDFGMLTMLSGFSKLKLSIPARHQREFAERAAILDKSERLEFAREKARARARAIAGKPRRKYDE